MCLCYSLPLKTRLLLRVHSAQITRARAHTHTHTHTHTRTHARTHARARARTHTHTHIRAPAQSFLLHTKKEWKEGSVEQELGGRKGPLSHINTKTTFHRWRGAFGCVKSRKWLGAWMIRLERRLAVKPSPLHPQAGRSAPCVLNEGHGGSPVCGGNSSVPLASRELFTVRRGHLCLIGSCSLC